MQALSTLLPNHAETASQLRARAEGGGANGGIRRRGGRARGGAQMEKREAARPRAEEEEAARWEARRLAGIHAHMERAKAAVRVSRK